MNPLDSDLGRVLEQTRRALGRVRHERPSPMRVQEVGRVLSVSGGIARVQGLPHVGSEELIRFEGGEVGLTFNLDPGEIGVILLDSSENLAAGDRARRTERVLDVPVGEALNGRVVDALGRPLDGEGPIRTSERWPVEREAPAVLDRAPVTQPLQTGWKVVDALIPIGRGQRELILGDRQTGKTTLALDTIINQKHTRVRCFYCAIGQRNAAVAGVIEELRRRGAMEYTTVIVAGEEDPPGLRYVAPYGAMSMAEWIRDRGGDALLVFDDMTRHARSYRELSLLLRRPPGREAFPGDIFYIHSRLLERSTHLRDDLGGGSLTALPIIETQAENISDYIPTNLISITDGQVYLSPSLFQKGVLPAVDVGKSVSRVGGKTQLPAYRSVVGDLRLSYSQFQELESFAHFGARLEQQTRRQLERGRRVREVLKQPEHDPLPAPEQIAVLWAVTEGLMDDLSLEEIPKGEEAIRRRVRSEGSEVLRRIESGEQLGESDRERLRSLARDALESRQGP